MQRYSVWNTPRGARTKDQAVLPYGSRIRQLARQCTASFDIVPHGSMMDGLRQATARQTAPELSSHDHLKRRIWCFDRCNQRMFPGFGLLGQSINPPSNQIAFLLFPSRRCMDIGLTKKIDYHHDHHQSALHHVPGYGPVGCPSSEQRYRPAGI